MAGQINIIEIKNKILELIKLKGPCLPVHISRELQISTLLSSALLSELVSNKKIKISNLKVGGSPIYYINGQEKKLENYSQYLPRKEREAFSLLKQKSVLQDNKQLPAIRVALRSIKDFAIPFQLEIKGEKQLFWRYFDIDEEIAKNKIKEIEQKAEPKKLIEPAKPKTTQRKKAQKNLLSIKKQKPKKIKEKSEFVKKIISILSEKDIEIIEEINYKKREYEAICKINTQLGKIEYLCIAKDKKSITENDLRIGLQKAQSIKRPLLLISGGEMKKKAQTYLENWQNLIKIIQI